MNILCNRASGNPFDVDIRNIAKRSDFISLSDVEATGLFVCGESKALRFTATGEIGTQQAANHRTTASSDLKFEFAENELTTQCSFITQDTKAHWQVNSSTCSGSSNELFQLKSLLSGDQVAGTAKLKIDQFEQFAKLPRTNNADLVSGSYAALVVPAEWVEVSVTGSFAAPQVRLQTVLPNEFVEAITGKMMEQIELQRTQSEGELRAAVEQKASRRAWAARSGCCIWTEEHLATARGSG